MGKVRPNRARNPWLGVNISGPEFAPWNGQTFPTGPEWDYLRRRGVGFVRLPIAWESVQPTLSAALDATYSASITTALNNALSRGIGVILELHNFGCYADQTRWTHVSGSVGYAGNAGVVTTGVNALGDGTLTSSHLGDVWTRITTAWGSHPAIIGLGIMNEPSDAVIGTNLLTRPNYLTQETGGDWFPSNSATVTQQAAGTNPLGANYSPAWTLAAGAAFANWQESITLTAVLHAISVYSSCAAGTEAGSRLWYGPGSGNFTATTTAQRFVQTFTPSAGAVTCGVGHDTSGHSITVSNLQVEKSPATSTSSSISGSVLTVAGTIAGTFAVGQEITVGGIVKTTIASLGTGAGGAGTYNLSNSPGNVSGVAIIGLKPYEPNRWVPYAQAAITAIRALNTLVPIYVCGNRLSAAVNWDKENFELFPLLSGSGFVMEGHAYPDAAPGFAGSSVFSGSWASYGRTAADGANMVAPFFSRATSQGFTPFIGETGIPGGDANWAADQDNTISAAKRAGARVTLWFYGANGVQPYPTNKLNIAYGNDARLLSIAA